MAARNQPNLSLLDLPNLSLAAAEGAFVPFHPHDTSIRNNGHFNEKKQKHENLHEARHVDLHPHHQQHTEAILVNLDDELSKDEIEKRLKVLSIKAEVPRSRQEQLEMNMNPAKIASTVENIVNKHPVRNVREMSFKYLQSIYEVGHLEASPEEILSFRYRYLNKLVMDAQSLSKATMGVSGSDEQCQQLGVKIRCILYQLWDYHNNGINLMKTKIKKACIFLTFCLENMERSNVQAKMEQLKCDEEVSGITGGYKQQLQNDPCTLNCKIGLITMKILQLQRKARQDINSVVANLDRQIAVCRYQLNALDLDANDANLMGMWQDAINLCNSSLQQLGLAASPFNIPG